MSELYDDESDAFEFETGDTVLVRIRGDDGTLCGKFVAHVQGFQTGRLTSDRAVFSVPWGSSLRPKLTPYEADYEVIEDESEVTF